MSKKSGSKEYSILVKIEALVTYTLSAADLDQAFAKAKEETKELAPFAEGIDYIDGSINLSGVTEI